MGKITRTEAEIAELRASRAAKKAKIASQSEVERLFSSFEGTKNSLRLLCNEIRNQRKSAVEQGVKSFRLSECIKRPYYLAFEHLPYNPYRVELGDLSIEGLKVQDREVKVFTFHFNDKLLESGFIDWGWIIRMLGKKYVSRYGWELLRRHSDQLSDFGGKIIGSFLDEWAKDPETWAKWERLSQEDGKPADMRSIFPK